MKRQLWEVTAADAGVPLSGFLQQRLSLNAESAIQLVRQGAVYLEGRRSTAPEQLLRVGAKVMAVLEERGQGPLGAVAGVSVEVQRLYEDSWLLVVAKPAGMVSQPTQARVGHSVWDWALRRYGPEVGLVHRLDRETSGVLVLGRHRKATAALAAQFQLREARKRYLAVTGPGFPLEGTVDLPLSKDRARIGRRIAGRGSGDAAVTEYRRMGEGAGFSVVELRPQTGRTHQLRAHLRALGFPIAGDKLYEGPPLLSETLTAERCLLHALELSLRHPQSGERVSWKAPPPPDLERYLRTAGLTPPY